MKKEITPATAIVIVLIVLAVIGGIYYLVSKPKENAATAPPAGLFPNRGGATAPGTPPPAPPVPGQ